MRHRTLVETLGPAVRGPGAAAYLRLAGALRGLMLDGRLVVGETLPAERTLARELGVSRTTVTSALTLLRSEGSLESRQGSGTVVARAPDAVDRPDETGSEPGRHPVHVDLTIAAPTAPPGLGPLAEQAVAGLPALLGGHGLHPIGLRALRQAIARRLTARGLETGPDQVLVTQGALHAWDLVLRAFVRPGDPVAVEQPSYPGAIDAARAHTATLVPIGVDAVDGWAGPPRSTVLALVTPDHHNPTGAYADDDARADLLRALRPARVVVDETCVELGLDGRIPAAPLGARHPDVIIVGSLSKLAWPGIRVGWVRAGSDVVARLASSRAGQDLAAPVLDQLLALAVLDELDAIRAHRVAELAHRRDHLLAALTAAGWNAHRPAGGLVAWVDLGGVSSTALAVRARAEGVRVAPGPRFSLGATHDRFLRVPYCHPPEVLSDAVSRLSRAAAATGPSTPGDDGALPPRWTA